MKRALVFLLLGPVIGVLIVLSLMIVATGGPSDLYGYPIVFFFCLISCAITAPVDGILAHVVPISTRAPLIAIVGSAVLVGVGFYLWGSVESKMVLLSLVVGAITTGTCSLLSHDFRG